MQRLFGQIKENEAIISPSDLHHILNVKRFKVGEKLEVVDGSFSYLCELVSLSPVKIEVKEKLSFDREIKTKIALAFALLKGDHNSLIVEKCTELGATIFYPCLTSRCVIKAEVGKDDNRIERLSKVIKGASEQSRRTFIPEIKNTLSFKEILSLPYKHKVIAYEGLAGSSETFVSYLKNHQDIDEILILIGPEGGFSENEVKEAIEAGFAAISLGKTILRGETACISSVDLAANLLG